MIDPKTEEWVKLAEMGDDNEIRFTKEWMDITQDLCGERRRFTSLLITHWDLSLASMLDYFGPDELEKDLYTGVDGEPMDVREDIPSLWEYKEMPFEGLSSEWYRDVMRAKLITLSLPVRLVNEYAKAYKNL